MAEQKKSKAVFAFLAVLAIVMLVAASVFVAEAMPLMTVVSLIIFVAVFGVGFTLKKKYRENGWL